ncbi:trimeric intracellular cation channel family protein [Stakelama sediminis]|uniref:Putative membrane protein YeiH n=1 Tax=Stakelama sediminis TaxID=463200 RepID=A0A840YXY7_9SPHN|nr:trimeric intracellular cation channel family protein [Stakelama sediminis]MBB5718402.1 putative membrane protein YeiH [Stakelama sediminis]
MTPPVAWQFGPLLPWLDLIAIALFAATGALAATRSGQTFVTAAFFALVTGVGGGTMRDLLIGAPVFWVHDRMVAGMCVLAALLVWIAPQRWWSGVALAWIDAMGLAAYAVFGAAKSLGFGVPPIPAMVMGVVTACLGGIIRDMLAGTPSILMRPELYVTAAALASALYVVLRLVETPSFLAALLATGAGFGLRAAAIHWNLGLPAYRGKR